MNKVAERASGSISGIGYVMLVLVLVLVLVFVYMRMHRVHNYKQPNLSLFFRPSFWLNSQEATEREKKSIGMGGKEGWCTL